MKKLKSPELKMPDFLADLYYDLRDRRLLPLVALIVVAIAAVPFLLGGGAKPSLPAPGVGAAALESSPEKTSSLTVVQAEPGLRDYRKRLRDRTPTDPFKQHYTGLPKAAQLQVSGGGPGGGSSSSSSSNEEAVTTTESSTTAGEVNGGGGGSGGHGSSGGGSGTGSGGPGKPKPHLVLFDYAIDARISRSEPPGQGSGQPQEPVVKQRVLPQTPLPGEKAPVVTYLGPGRKQGDKTTGKVLLLVGGDVKSISGEYGCVSRNAEVCQLLEVEPGFPLDFAFGDNGVHYTIKVLKIELVVIGHS